VRNPDCFPNEQQIDEAENIPQKVMRAAAAANSAD